MRVLVPKNDALESHRNVARVCPWYGNCALSARRGKANRIIQNELDDLPSADSLLLPLASRFWPKCRFERERRPWFGLAKIKAKYTWV
jgi:hypothetical protein